MFEAQDVFYLFLIIHIYTITVALLPLHQHTIRTGITEHHQAAQA